MEETNELKEELTSEETMMESEENEPKSTNANETKNEKFIRLAEYRVNKIMTAIASLDKLHNRGAYDYTDEQVTIMFESLENQLAEVKGHFNKTKATQESKFSFK